jgi:hypothetical protein
MRHKNANSVSNFKELKVAQNIKKQNRSRVKDITQVLQ